MNETVTDLFYRICTNTPCKKLLTPSLRDGTQRRKFHNRDHTTSALLARACSAAVCSRQQALCISYHVTHVQTIVRHIRTVSDGKKTTAKWSKLLLEGAKFPTSCEALFGRLTWNRTRLPIHKSALGITLVPSHEKSCTNLKKQNVGFNSNLLISVVCSTLQGTDSWDLHR